METTQCKDIWAYDRGTRVILTDQLNYEANAQREIMGLFSALKISTEVISDFQLVSCVTDVWLGAF